MPTPDSHSWLDFAGSLVVPSISLLSSAAIASLSYFLGRKKQIEEDHRKVKSEVYEGFYRAFLEVASDMTTDNQKNLSIVFNRLIFTGSDDVVKSAVVWWSEVISAGNKAEPNSVSLKALIDTMRKDLGVSKRPILANSPFVGIGWKPKSSSPPS